MVKRVSWYPPPVCHCKRIFIRTYTCLIWSTSVVCAGTTSLSNRHKWSSYECQIQSETLCRWHCFFILPSQHLPNQRFSRKILTTLNAGIINGTPLNTKSFTWHVPKPNSYTLYSSQLHTGICIFSTIYWCRHLFRPITGYAHKSHF